ARNDPRSPANDIRYAKLKKVYKKDDANVRQLADLSGPTADWLIGLGADLGRVINGSQHTRKAGGAFGAMLAPVLLKEVQRRNIELRCDTAAKSLVFDGDGHVAGVRVQSEDGPYVIRAKSVVLAAGGFASSPALVKRFSPQWAGYPSTASVGVTGDGILMAEKAGARLADMDLTGPQTVAYDTGSGAVSLTAVRYNGAIIVNKAGQRFVNELGNTAVIGKKITEQAGGSGYLVFDQASMDRAAVMKKYMELGYFVKADTVAQLAAKLGVDANGLEATVQAWHGVIDSGKDAAFGRKDSLFSRIDKAPYYGQRISPASQTTYGGVVRDKQGHALRKNGSIIPGLFVAGETACQYGQGLTIAVVTGRIAGKHAAQEAMVK
ncbi:MAG: FAD-binding protein, partial [Duodenibacillus sp.]|nr:FAD-binding protein [Duodenibacillus sp.]